MTPEERLKGYQECYLKALALMMNDATTRAVLLDFKVKDLRRIKQVEQRMHENNKAAVKALIMMLRLQAEILEASLLLDNIETPDTLPEGGI